MRDRNKQLLMLLTLAMCIQEARAQFDYSTNGDGSVELSEYTGSGGVVVISNFVNYIGTTAFEGYTSLNSVIMPDSVISIGDYAFYGCSLLTNVAMDSFVTNIGAHVFYGCLNLHSLTIPESVTSIGIDAFSDCGLSSVTIPNGVTSIATGTFINCSASSVIIGSGVTNIGSDAFYESEGLANVNVGGSVTTIGSYAFYYCQALKSICFEGNAPTNVGTSAFSGDSHATVYYLPGTTGWGTNFAGRPTAVWQSTVPQGFEFIFTSANQLSLRFTGTPTFPYILQSTTNLSPPIQWQATLTNLSDINGNWNFGVTNLNQSECFYRVFGQ